VTLHTALAPDAFGGLARGWLEEAGCRVEAASGSAATAVNVTATNSRAPARRVVLSGLPGRAAAPGLADPRPTCGAGLRLAAPAVAGDRPRIRGAPRAGVLTAFDPGPLLGRPWTLAALGPLLGQLDLLLANDHELRVLSRASDLPTALRRFRRHHAGHVVVKCGGDGALWLPAGAQEPRIFRIRPVRVVNTVGAGRRLQRRAARPHRPRRGFPRRDPVGQPRRRRSRGLGARRARIDPAAPGEIRKRRLIATRLDYTPRLQPGR
jgi:hypothetical protein